MGNNAGFEVYGHSGKLSGLAGEQAQHLGKLRALLTAIDGQARTTLSKWEGAGQGNAARLFDEYQQHFQQVNAAFQKLVTSTEGAGNEYAALGRRLEGMF
ncbi:WXG100 family type VII secretion target [Actinomadura physcomitrii]|uniref:WXG100 family type VII secretion target n=1 Tax=Actinomadura physcomitrii TaxID=2650748 RepID=UPI00136FCDCD|nr:WXG100 family type VII secretion target [Actinomadura physcomitrii]